MVTRLSGQCTQDVRIDFVSIDYKSGCDFGDSNGLDPKLDIFIPGGALIYTSHYGDQSQVSGPLDGVPIDDSVSDNECGNFDIGFTIRDLDNTTKSIDVAVDIYEKDSNIINDQCSEFNGFLDDNLSRGTHTFDFTQSNGRIDVGGCMVYNYIIERRFSGAATVDENITLCPGDTIIINGTAYHQDNATDNIFIQGNPDACDTTIIIALSFFNETPLVIESQDTLCKEGTQTIMTSVDYDIYSWNTGATTKEIIADSAGSYTVTVTSVNGCQQTSSLEIAEVVVDTPQIIGDSTFCEGISTILEVISSASAIEWNTGSNNNTITITEPDEYSVTVTDNTGCTSSSTILVSSISEPTIEFDNPLSFCEGDILVLSTNNSYSQYFWSSGNTTPSEMISEGGDYSLTVTDTNGCTGTKSFAVEEFSLPVPTFESRPILCEGEATTLMLTESFESYQWSDNSTLSTLLIASGGEYAVTVTDRNGCTGIQAITIDNPNSLMAMITGPTEICEGDIAILSEGLTNVTHLWSNGMTTNSIDVDIPGIYTVTITDLDGCTASSSAELNILVNIITEIERISCDPTLIGVVEMEIPNGTICPDIERVTTILGEDADCMVSINIQTQNTSCPAATDGTVLITVAGPSELLPLSAQVQANNVVLDTTLNSLPIELVLRDLEVENYEITISNQNGTITRESFTIGSEIVIPSQFDDIIINAGEEVLLSTSVDTILYTSVFWSSSNELLCVDNCTEVLVSPDSTTIYTFSQVNESTNCQVISNQRVIVQQDNDLYIPNIFNVNLSGDDGLFRIEGPGIQSFVSMEIYDRWGSIVFITDDATIGWDGRVNNTVVNSGIYVYRMHLNLDGEETLRTGTVMVMR